jgi:tRNA dimethylallyltransferase
MRLAARHAVEVVSIDSMQVYRGMDIGTAKPSRAEMALVPHHMIDVLDPGDTCNVAQFCRMADRAIADIRSRDRTPLLVGGSPLYMKGLMWGIMEGVGSDPEVRGRLEKELAERGREALHRRLVGLDPEAAARVHPNDVQRLIRALEVCELTGSPFSAGQTQFAGPPRLAHVMVGLRRPREELYARIDKRVDDMMAQGLLAEVEGLQGRLGPQARQALGYKELRECLEGCMSLAQAVDLTKRNTRRFAKHQLTWFRHFPRMWWVNASACEGADALAERCDALLSRSA